MGDERIYVPAIAGRAGDRIRLRIRARDVALALTKPTDISVLNILAGRITEIASGGDGHSDIRLDIGGGLWARITRRSANELALHTGREVYALIKSVAIDRERAPEAGTKGTRSYVWQARIIRRKSFYGVIDKGGPGSGGKLD